MRNLLTGLDVGTSKVCAIVGESLPDGQLATLGFGISPCTGLRKGVVVNIEATVDAIKAAVEEAEKTSGVRVGSVVVGVLASSFYSGGVLVAITIGFGLVGTWRALGQKAAPLLRNA